MKLSRTVFQAARGLILGLLILMGLLALALVFIALPPGENFIRGIAQDKISRALGQRLSIENLETNLFNSLKLRHVVLYSSPPNSTQPLASIAFLEIHYHLFPLLRQRLVISSLRMDTLTVDLIRDSTGLFNLELLNHTEPETATVKTGSGLGLEFTDATIHHGDLAYRDLGGNPKTFRLEGIEVAAEGKNGRYSANLKADSGLAAYRELTLPFHVLDLKTAHNPGEYILEHLSVQLPGTQLSVTAAMRQDSSSLQLESTAYAIQGNLHLQGDITPLADSCWSLLPPTLFPISGVVDLDLSLGGNTNQLNVKMDLGVQNAQVFEVRVPLGVIQARWKQDLVNLDSLELDLLGGHLSAQGELTLDSLRCQLAATIEGFDSDQIWELIKQNKPRYQAIVGGQTQASGLLLNPQSWEAITALHLRQIQYLDQPVADVNLNLDIHRGTADIDMRQAQTQVHATGQFDNKSVRGSFTADILQLQSLAGLAGVSDLTGQVRLQGAVIGPLDAPVVSASLQGANLRYRNFPVDSLSGSLHFDGKQLYFQEITFKGALVQIDPSAPPFELAGLQGSFQYEGHAQGPLDGLAGDLSVKMQKLTLNNLRFDEGVIQARMAGSKVALTLLKLRRESLLVQGTGDFFLSERTGNLAVILLQESDNEKFHEDSTLADVGDDSITVTEASADKISTAFSLPGAGEMSVQMTAREVRMEEVLALISTLPVKATLKHPLIRGKLNFNLSAGGTLSQPRAQLDFGTDEIVIETLELDSARGRAVFDNGQITLETFQISREDFHTRGEASLTLSGMGPVGYRLSPDSPTRGFLKGEEMEAALLAAFLPPGIMAQGQVSYDLNWNGTVAEPRPQGKLILEQGLVQLPGDVPPIENVILQVDLHDSRVKIDQLGGSVEKVPFNMTGTVDLGSQKNLDLDLNLTVAGQPALSVRGSVATDRLQLSAGIQNLNLTVLQPLAASLENLKGTLNASLKINGSLHEPHLTGHLEGQGLTFKPASLRDAFEDGLLVVDFQDNRVTLDTLYLRLKEGSVFVAGGFVYQNGWLDEINLTARASDLILEELKAYSVRVNSALITYTSLGNYLNLDGDVYLGKSKITTNFDAAALLPLRRRVERPTAEPSPFMTATRMDLRLHGGEDLKVENNVANVTLAPELSLIGTLAAPNITGHVSVVKGSVTFLDRKFTVTQGVVDFADPVKINPIVDIAAETTIRRYQGLEAVSYDIYLSVSGPADTLIVELTSDPPMERPDILSLLTLGATREQLAGVDTTGGQTSTGDLLVQRAQTLTTYALSGVLSRTLGARLGLETLTIQGNIFQAGQNDVVNPTLEATKQVSDRLLITYTTNVGYFNQNGIKVNYLLNKYFSVQGQTDQTGQSGIDLKYSVRFK
jgi:autotransporter translocation and assembly factor TamB